MGDAVSAVEEGAASVDDFVPWLPELGWLGVAVGDTKTQKLLRANRAFLELIGRTPEDLANGLDVLDLTGADSKRDLDKQFQDLRAAGVVNLFTKTYCHADGSVRRAWVTGTLVPHAPRFSIIYALDVTEREAAVDALRESEERGRRFAQASFEGLFIHENGIIVDVNEPLLAMFRVTREDVIGRSGFAFAAPGSIEQIKRHIAADYEQPYESVARRPDGTTFPVELMAKRLPTAGRALRVTAIRDITERKRTELALREAETALIQTQKIESLGLLAGGIAHDFNNILGIVLGFAAVARKDLEPGSRASNALDEIERAATRASELARQMLVYSGRSPKSLDEVHINAVVAETVRLVEPSFAKKIDLVLELAPDAPSTLADRTQIQQVVLNLLTNAAEAIGAGRGTVHVATKLVSVAANSIPAAKPGAHLAPGNYVELVVRDDGVGMDEATLARIFDPFFTTKAAGRGLGLSAMLGILRGHDAGIAIDTKPGAGTTFRLYFPTQARAMRAPSVPAPPRQGTQTGTILVVDDETALRQSTRKILESAGHRVLEASDGTEAAAIFRERHAAIDLVLLDLVMPELDGRECLASLRAVDEHARVLLMSGYDALEVRDGIGDDVAGFLAKPYDEATLLSAVATALATPLRESGSESGARVPER